jgi:amidase
MQTRQRDTWRCDYRKAINMSDTETTTLQRVPRENAMKFLIGPGMEPVLTVDPGERFVLETEDALAGKIRSEDRLPIPEHVPELAVTPAELNPVAGPIRVRGAKRGDALAVTIEAIDVDPQGMTCVIPGVGPLNDSFSFPECRGPFTRIIRHEAGPSGTMRDGRGHLDDSVSWDLQPFIGTIGTTPDRETEGSLVGQGAWGGNMDCREIKPGHTLLLPCFHDDALLFVGDVHGSQADTEFYGIADETRADVTLSCDIRPGMQLANPRIETGHSIISLYSYRPLEDAVQGAMLDLFRMMVNEYGVPEREAYMHLCINPEVRVHVFQMIAVGRIQYTAGAEIPTKFLDMYAG